MTKTQKEWLTVAGVIGAFILLLWLVTRLKSNGSTAVDSGVAPDTTGTPTAPYQLTFNQSPPGASNYGAPYYGPITFNSGCGCDSGMNNIQPATLAAQTGSNSQLNSALNGLIPDYIANIIQAE